jgi:hypothetical protein
MGEGNHLERCHNQSTCRLAHKHAQPPTAPNAVQRSTHQVALVEQQQQVLVPRVLLEVLLQVAAPRAQGVTRVQYLAQQQHTPLSKSIVSLSMP